MEGWMISSIISLVTLVASGAVVKFMVGKHEAKIAAHDERLEELYSVPKELEVLVKRMNASFVRLDRHGDDLVEMRAEASHNLTHEKADALYLRISEFVRFEKHLDDKFEDLGKFLEANSELLKKVLFKLEDRRKD